MKTNHNYGLVYILLTVVQIIICNYFRISPYLTLSILPAMVICIPSSRSTVSALLIAFATGLAVDALSEGILGLNALALVPVAFIRTPLMRLLLGKEVNERHESLNIRYNGLSTVSVAIAVAQTLFLAIYILADGAGMRPFWFNISRFAASLACNYLLSLIAVNILNPAAGR